VALIISNIASFSETLTLKKAFETDAQLNEEVK